MEHLCNFILSGNIILTLRREKLPYNINEKIMIESKIYLIYEVIHDYDLNATDYYIKE